MRCSPTRSEEWLWRRLSGSKTGFAFRRQLVIGEHIVDFACTKVRLVVEVDGAYHEERARHDGARDRALNKLGSRSAKAHASVARPGSAYSFGPRSLGAPQMETTTISSPSTAKYTWFSVFGMSTRRTGASRLPCS